LPDDDLDLALALAHDAGRLLVDCFGRVEMELKAENDAVTAADRASEALIARRLRDLRPGDGLVAEEGTTINPAASRQWVVDPLDATNNYAHRFWIFAVSIALVENGEPAVGVVYCPFLQQTFSATRAGGAFLNGRPIRVSQTREMGRAIVATGFPYARRTLARNNLAEFNRVTMAAQGVRRVGAATLDLCWTACGVWDGYWEFHLKPWDIAAGMLICREAGGTVTDLAGRPVNLTQPEIMATNGHLHTTLLEILNRK